MELLQEAASISFMHFTWVSGQIMFFQTFKARHSLLSCVSFIQFFTFFFISFSFHHLFSLPLFLVLSNVIYVAVPFAHFFFFFFGGFHSIFSLSILFIMSSQGFNLKGTILQCKMVAAGQPFLRNVKNLYDLAVRAAMFS